MQPLRMYINVTGKDKYDLENERLSSTQNSMCYLKLLFLKLSIKTFVVVHSYIFKLL